MNLSSVFDKSTKEKLEMINPPRPGMSMGAEARRVIGVMFGTLFPGHHMFTVNFSRVDNGIFVFTDLEVDTVRNPVDSDFIRYDYLLYHFINQAGINIHVRNVEGTMVIRRDGPVNLTWRYPGTVVSGAQEIR